MNDSWMNKLTGAHPVGVQQRMVANNIKGFDKHVVGKDVQAYGSSLRHFYVLRRAWYHRSTVSEKSRSPSICICLIVDWEPNKYDRSEFIFWAVRVIVASCRDDEEIPFDIIMYTKRCILV